MAASHADKNTTISKSGRFQLGGFFCPMRLKDFYHLSHAPEWRGSEHGGRGCMRKWRRGGNHEKKKKK